MKNIVTFSLQRGNFQFLLDRISSSSVIMMKENYILSVLLHIKTFLCEVSKLKLSVS